MKRRKFMKCVAATGAAMLVPVELFREMGISYAGGNQSRYLINLIGAGGWDSTWFHNTMSQMDLNGVPGSFVSSTDVGFEFAQSVSPYMFTYKGGLFSESAQLWTHPNGKTLLGPAMKFVYQNPSELNDVLIWRGMIAAGSHTLGNQLILQGNNSSYALSFSALVAGATAQTSLKPLHYLMLADQPTTLFSNFALNAGAQIPICIADMSEFVGMTQTTAQDLTSKSAQGALQAAITALGAKILPSELTFQGNRALASTYTTGFNNALSIYGSNMLQSTQFSTIFNSYLNAVFSAFSAAAADQNIINKAGIGAFRYQYNTTYLTVLQDTAALASLIGTMTVQEWVAGTFPPSTKFSGPYTPSWLIASGLFTQIYNFALAEFVVSNDLSAVVDLPAWTGFVDAHGGSSESYLNELLVHLATFASFRRLVLNLKGKQPAGGGTGTLLDQTMIVMSSEFDRLQYQTVGNGASAPGTNHGSTTSILLAGFGVNKGQVVGDFNRGPNIHAPSLYPGAVYLGPMPIDPATGLVLPTGSGGQTISSLAILPTLLQAFGVAVPARQTTQNGAVPAVLAG